MGILVSGCPGRTDEYVSKRSPDGRRVARLESICSRRPDSRQARCSGSSAPGGRCGYAKYRLPDGHQVQKKLGPAWTERGRPPAGYFTKRTSETWLSDVLDRARRWTLPGMVRPGATFGPDDLVFVGQGGDHLDGSALRCRFKRARDAAGLRALRFHDLRHTFGSVAIRAADPCELQEWLGHSDFSTTQIYLHPKRRLGWDRGRSSTRVRHGRGRRPIAAAGAGRLLGLEQRNGAAVRILEPRGLADAGGRRDVVDRLELREVVVLEYHASGDQLPDVTLDVC